MLQQEQPDDYVIATGETHSVQEFVEKAFGIAGLDYRDYVKTDDVRLHRSAAVDALIGDPAKARTKLGWKSRTSFRQLVQQMMESDCAAVGVTLKIPRAISRLRMKMARNADILIAGGRIPSNHLQGPTHAQNI